MNYFYRTLAVIFIATIPFLSVAQKDVNAPQQGQTTHQHTPWCATEYSDEQLESLEEFVEYYYHRGGKEEMAASERAIIYVPIAYHLVANTDGSGKYGLAKALSNLCTLNQDMLHTDIQFYLKYDIDLSIENDAWNTGTSTGSQTPTQLSLMVPFNNEVDAINMYQVTRIRDDNGVAGFAHGSVFHNANAPSATQSAVFIKKGSGGSGETVAHEFGHHFSLPHTFFGWEGQSNDYVCGSKAPAWAERYSGSNCTTQGDRFCDTSPDYLFGGWTCSGSGNLNTACTQMDADSATGFSDGSNIMSYAFQCSNRAFSVDQINAMTWHLNNLRQNLIGTTPNTTAITASATLTSPVGSSSDGYDATTFTWDPVPNATHYAIEINRTPTFPDGLMVDMAVVANGTSYTSTKLDPGTNYHWRIIPYNEGYHCANPSAKKSFTSSDFASNTNTIEGVETIDLMPNPTHSGQSANLVIKSDKSFEAGINIYDVSGRLISSEQRAISSGSTVHSISTIGMSAGIYIVAVQSENGVINKKLVITE